MLSDTDREMLETIEVKLIQINEAFLLKEIDEATFAFGIHDALAKLPTPNRPAHLLSRNGVTRTK